MLQIITAIRILISGSALSEIVDIFFVFKTFSELNALR